MARVTVEFEDGTERVYDGASIHDSIEDSTVTVSTFNTATRRSDVHTLPLGDVAAWTEEPE